MNTFQWLLVLGFPQNVAAAKTMPDLFSEAEPLAHEDEERSRTARLSADRGAVA